MRVALDTSTRVQSVALETPDGAIVARAYEAPQHSRALVGSIRGLLEEHGAGWGDVSAYVVGLGPGSFTGLRVGLALVKGLSAVHGTPGMGVCSLAAAAYGAATPLAAVAYDAKKDLVYAGVFRTSGTGEAVVPVTAYAPEAFAEASGACEEPMECLGDGWTRYGRGWGRAPRARRPAHPAPARSCVSRALAVWSPRTPRRSSHATCGALRLRSTGSDATEPGRATPSKALTSASRPLARARSRPTRSPAT